jgi:8-oxo-dGTP pyrophosphatase MutT (NUDIX family)
MEPICALAEAGDAIHSRAVSVSERRSRAVNLHPRLPSAAYVRPSQLQNLKGSQQAAAICFRIGTAGIEFLLVRTGSGRWTFPKGAVESGLTLAQSAALEAFEEAGVHGRIEEAPFGRYLYRKRGAKGGARRQLSVHAHLCQVRRLSRPKELHRKPTWFSVGKAKRRLQQDRAPDCAAELTRVLVWPCFASGPWRQARSGTP